MEGIKLEAGKFYRTRSGKKAFVAGQNPHLPKKVSLCWAGWVGERMCNWQSPHADGVCYATAYGAGPCEDDLIAEWVEPKRIKGWVAIKGDGDLVWPDPNLHKTQADARACSLSVVACIEIDVLEGQGLDGSAA